MHFAITNPRWQPPPQSELFLSQLKEKVQQDAAAAPPAQRILAEGPLGASLLSEDSAAAVSGTGTRGCRGIRGSLAGTTLDACLLLSRMVCWPVSWPGPSSLPAGWCPGTGASPSPAAPPAPPPASWHPWRPPCLGRRVAPPPTALAATVTAGSLRRGPGDGGLGGLCTPLVVLGVMEGVWDGVSWQGLMCSLALPTARS